MRPYLIGGALLVLLGLLGGGLVLAQLGRTARQPIAFNHHLHVEELGAECTDCHLYAETGVRATIPNLAVCADCHEEAQGESAEEAKLVELIQGGTPIRWRKVYTVPDHVYFSHRRHTAIAGIECERCHGDVRQRSEPFGRPTVDLDMDHCMGCHYETGTSNDCMLCHR